GPGVMTLDLRAVRQIDAPRVQDHQLKTGLYVGAEGAAGRVDDLPGVDARRPPTLRHKSIPPVRGLRRPRPYWVAPSRIRYSSHRPCMTLCSCCKALLT